MTPIRLRDLHQCLQGIVPSIIATSDARGVPNITYISQVECLDDRHVALSCQFFNKTRRNLDENPLAAVEIADPVSLQPYRLQLKFLRSEKSGPLFDRMAIRIEAIASHTGMSGVFKLIAADVFEVLSVERVEGALAAAAAAADETEELLAGLRTEVRRLQWVAERINRACDLETLLDEVLTALEEFFGFRHTMVLLNDECTQRLTTIASRGYGVSGVGAEVRMGEGVIGMVAQQRRVVRLSALERDLQYWRTIRHQAQSQDVGAQSGREIPLPGLAQAQSMVAIPLALGDRLLGVLVAEDRDPLRFGEWHEAYLDIVGNQIALGLDRIVERPDEEPLSTRGARAHLPTAPQATPWSAERAATARRIAYYTSDDAIFVDDEYLIRNVPARILWKVLSEWRRSGRTEFSNRELRLDATLGLPPIKDNLESRLILLRKRLGEKCPDLQLTSTGRGRFSLRVGAAIELQQR